MIASTPSSTQVENVISPRFIILTPTGSPALHSLQMEASRASRSCPHIGHTNRRCLLLVRAIVTSLLPRHPQAVVLRQHGVPDVLERLIARSEEHTSELQSRENIVCL